MDKATPKEKRTKWLKGYIPVHYKRLNISMQEAFELAKIGYEECYIYFKDSLYFTQSLLFGAVVSGRYKTITVVTPSQYGKSYLIGKIAIWKADMGNKVRIGASTEKTTEIIMNYVITNLQNVHQSVKDKIIMTTDKIEKLQSSVTKKKLTWQGGGLIEAITFGGASSDAKQYNQAIGRGGDYILDEASTIPDDAYAELGRREFSNDNGEKGLLFQISNPHNAGQFYDKLTDEDPPKDSLIVWMDIRTAYEEGRWNSKQQIIESDFFKNDSTCKRYLLCELENFLEESMFEKAKIIESMPDPKATYFLGIDSAYKGKDNINICLTALERTGIIKVIEILTINKGTWVDGETSQNILSDILSKIVALHIPYICVDEGWGVYIIENLAKEAQTHGFKVQGIAFQAGTTQIRAKANHFSAKYGYNMRAEMHLDLQQLMNDGKIEFTRKALAQLKDQLLAVKSFHKGAGKIAIIPKDEIRKRLKKSPDELDSLLLSVHACIMYTISNDVFLYA